MVDAILYHPEHKQQYLTRLRELLEKYSASGWLEAQAKDIMDAIGPDARADAAGATPPHPFAMR